MDRGIDVHGGWQGVHALEMARARRELVRAATVAMGDFVRDLRPWTFFLNPLTFDPRAMEGIGSGKMGRSDTPRPVDRSRSWTDGRHYRMPGITDWAAQRRFAWFLEASQEALNRQTAGVIALEHHKSGQPHGHGLLAVAGELRGNEIRVLNRLWRGYDGNGKCWISPPRSMADVSGYCAKYMCKDLGELVVSRSIRV